MAKPTSMRAAYLAIRAIVKPHKITLTEEPNPTLYLDNESEARFTASDWDTVIRWATQNFIAPTL